MVFLGKSMKNVMSGIRVIEQHREDDDVRPRAVNITKANL